ncbi:trichohyalin-like isoform X2 [Acanthaster planci]|uniref:Trichohyalin-like isoform X2 n=1 Tax=Acanthaster planci TaxID=133434 RepID=A0A8B7Z4I4_ACAPL|nr:trichohyalin-like isoform X2 [Acanthaster planci]
MSRPTAVNGILTNKNELDEINRRLKQNGIDPRIGDQAKLQELWHLFARTEADLLTSKQALSGAERQHAVEMQEVESYMEQVRHLSEERDALTQEFEMENDQLKKDVEKLRQEIADGKREVTQLLIQEGFMDLADGTPSEAIAYFLVERTRTMDELREAKRKAASSPGGAITTSKQVQEVLDKERKIMEEEMRTEREKVRKMKDSIEQDSKLKITSLESQKRRLEQEARHHHQKTRDLEFEMDRLKKSLEREKKERREEVEKLQQQLPGSPRDLNQSELSQLREAKKKLEMELSTTKYRLKTGEEDKHKLNQRVKELTESLDTEKKRRSSYEGTIIKLKSVVDRNKKLVTSLEDEKQTLSEEKSALQMRIGFLEKDLQELKEQERSLRNQTTSLKSEQTIIERQESEIKSLREEKEQQALKLQRTMVSLETERRKCLELGEKLTSTEEKWEQIVQRYKNNEKDLANKLDKLTRDLDFSKSELEANHQRMHQIQQEHDKQLEDARGETQTLKEQLQQEKGLSNQADRHRETIKELEGIVDELKKDRDVLARELQIMIGKEQKHKEKMMSIEQSAEEIKRLEAQLENSVMKQSSLVEELSEEKKRNQKLQDQLNFSQETLKIAEQSTDHLKESIGRKSAELVKQYDWSKENQLKLENKVKSLQRELDEARSMTHQDKTAVSWRLEREEKRVKELEDMLTEKKEELVEARRESGRILMNQTRAEERAQEEARLRLDVEQRNKVLEEEMTKQWTQLKDLMARLTANESAKQELEVQLEKQTNETRQRYSEIQQVQAETNATTSTLSVVQQRAQAAERKIPELQQQLDEKSLRLQATEAQLRDLTSTKIDLRTCKDDINRLKAQLHEERIDKSLLNQQLEDAKQQVAACIEREERLRHENSDMKHRLIETQNKLYATEDKSKSVEDMHSLAEQGKKSLRDQVSSLQQEVQRLQTELMQTSQRLDAQITKYEEHKLHHKNKIQQAREIFTRHKSVLADSLMKLQQDLNTTNAELQKEQNNRENLQKKHDSLLEEHRKLLALHSDAEEAVRDQNRNVSTMDYRVKYLERENGVLQDRIDTLSRQRVAMEKLIREYRLEKQKQEIDKSLLVSSSGGLVFPSSPLSTLNSTVPKTTLTSGLGLSQSPSYISTHDPRFTNSSHSLRSSQPGRIPGHDLSPANRELLRSPELSNTQSSDEL